MAAGCALNYSSLLQRDTLFKLPSINHWVENHILHGVVKTPAFPVKNTGFSVSRSVKVNTKHRFAVMCTSRYSYEVHQDRAARFGLSGKRKGDRDSKGDEGNELGPILNFEEVMLKAEIRGVCLPLDMFEAAKNTGIPRLCLERYLSMQGSGWGLGFAMRSSSIFRNQMMINPDYPPLLGLLFVSDLFGDVKTATAMIHRGKTLVDVIGYLVGFLLFRLVLHGLISPVSFNYRRRFLRLRESISRGFMRLFRHPNGSIPPCDRMFEAKAEKSEIFFRVAYCLAEVIAIGVLFLYFSYYIYEIRAQSPI